MRQNLRKRLARVFVILLGSYSLVAAGVIYIVEGKIGLNVFLALSIGLLVSSVAGYFIIKQFTRPVERLTHAARIISKGDFNYHIERESSDEVGKLAEIFTEMAKRLETTYNDLELYFIAFIRSLVNALEAKDRFTHGHSERVTKYAMLIAQEMKLSNLQVEFIKTIGLLHDIGKIGISEKILNKQDPLTDSEWREIRRHPMIGVDILNDINLLKPALSIVRSHHERPDGNGYPEGLSAGEIPTLASVISVADAFDAMCTERPYRKALSIEEAKSELSNYKGSQFRDDVVDVFLKLVDEGGMKR